MPTAQDGVDSYLKKYDKWRITSHGDNPWDGSSLLNVIAYEPYFDRIVSAIRGSVTSAYRSKRVNSIVGGAKSSGHLLGLAIDAKPGAGLTPESASRLLFSQCHTGIYGPVQKIIIEPTWVHVGWYPYFKCGPVTLMKYENKTYKVIEKA